MLVIITDLPVANAFINFQRQEPSDHKGLE